VPAWIALQRLPRDTGRGRAFAWLLLSVNLLTPFGYLLFSGLGNIGDWAVVIEGLEPRVVWRGALAVAGAVLYFLVAPRVLMPPLEPFLGAGAERRQARARTLALLPYVVGGLTFVLAGLLNPHGLSLVLISAAAASFGGTSLLAWYPGLWARRPAVAPEIALLGVPRSRGCSSPRPSPSSSSWACSGPACGSADPELPRRVADTGPAWAAGEAATGAPHGLAAAVSAGVRGTQAQPSSGPAPRRAPVDALRGDRS